MLRRKILQASLRNQSAGSFNSSFFKSSQSAGNYDVKEFCKTLDVKKRQAIEHELRRLRREGDENIAMHARTSVTVKPSNTQLRICFVHNAVPFIGFGFLDNFVMLIAGDYFEATLGVYFHISVLAAAGLGNTISDVVGIFFGGYIELVADRMGLPAPKFSAQEADSTHARVARNSGQAFGIVLGCLLGMCPLLFLDTEKHTREKPIEKIENDCETKNTAVEKIDTEDNKD